MIRISLTVVAILSLSACAARGPQAGIPGNPYGAFPAQGGFNARGQAPGQVFGQRQLPVQPVGQVQATQVGQRVGQGQYTRPAYLTPDPIPRIPETDFCQSQLYQGLIGKSEGAIYISGLPGRKRVLKPAFVEDFETEAIAGFIEQPPLLEVRDYLPQQVLYAPSIRTVTDRIQLGPEVRDRLTLELDQDGYVQEVRCG